MLCQEKSVLQIQLYDLYWITFTQKFSLILLTTEEKVKREVKIYEEFPTISLETEPLAWWKNEARNYPFLAPLMKKYLSICGTNVSSERLSARLG